MVQTSFSPWLSVEMPEWDYMDALYIQRTLADARAKGALDADLILFLEHPPVFTLGRKGNRQNLLVAEDFLGQRNIPVIKVERGGDVTYHGPGQLVGYLIVNLREKKWHLQDFVHGIEEVMIRTVAGWNIQADRNPLNRGIWLGLEKLGSIGIAVRKGISFHGFSLNVNLDLTPYKWINPCGLTGIDVTSMKNATGEDIHVKDVQQILKQQIQSVFQVDLQTESMENIQHMYDEAAPINPPA
jgi:lipoate-protein ligase B